MTADKRIHTRSLDQTNNMDEFVRAYVRRTPDAMIWNEGIYTIVHGNPSAGIATILGSRLVCKEELDPHLPELFGYADRPVLNACAQGIGNSFPLVANWFLRRTLSPGVEYVNDVGSSMFFQTSHDDAHTILAKHPATWPLRATGLVDPSLPTAHQSWLVPLDGLPDFMQRAGDLLTTHYPDVLSLIEMQDILYVPTRHGLLSPPMDGFAYTISCAARDYVGPQTQRIRNFYRDLSTVTARRACGFSFSKRPTAMMCCYVHVRACVEATARFQGPD